MSRFANLFIAAAVLLPAASAKPREQRWNFEDAKAGKLPEGWSSAKTGKGRGSIWKVLEDKSAPSGKHVLAQMSSRGPNRSFNLCVANKTSYKDFELSVSFKANTGRLDQGGGPVWRYQDARNYYVCRHNPLENNFRLYKVLAGRRIQLASADIKAAAGKWHTIHVAMHGDRIVCSFNGKRLAVRDKSISKAGKVGVWTKSDAVTSFDDLQVREK